MAEPASRKIGCSKLVQMVSCVHTWKNRSMVSNVVAITLVDLSERLPPVSQTALIVDDDIGFICWLGQVLGKAGYQSVPAINCRQAVAQLEKLQCNVDTAIVNPVLPGSYDLLLSLNRVAPLLKVVFVQNPRTDLPAGLRFHKVMQRPGAGHPFVRREWSRKLIDLLNRRNLTGI